MSRGEGLRGGLCLLLLCGSCVGCETVRSVRTDDPNSGAIAMPEDTPELRAKAEKLMHERFPNGYVIDDVRMIYVGAPYRTVVQFGPVAEVETHRRHEYLMTYHAKGTIGPAPYPPPPTMVAAPPPPGPGYPTAPAVQQVSAPPSAPLPDGLPPQPVPVEK